MAGTIWTERSAGSVTSSTRPGTSQGEHVTIYDPELSPDWLRMPDSAELPAHLRGRELRVECSCWFPLAPNADHDPDDPATWWLEQRTRWHVLAGAGTIAVAEVAGQGWCVLDVGPERLQVLRDSAVQP